jgi:regulator of protease activity HflC (stomatin/prohibitin superfamily)
VDISMPNVDESVPEYVFSKIPQLWYVKVEVAEYQKALVYFNQKLERTLDAGTYYFWRTSVKVDVSYVDTRLTRMNITGQEILTADKVSLRINFVCNYRVSDYVKILTEIDNFEEQIHVVAQLALREYVGKYKFDEILENKAQMTEFVFERLKAKEGELFVEITDAGVKDIILPGEIREIMNTVLVAEKRAQANVITRREEVASTRSLLNTAKLMDENKTLYKLKELEYVERIFENVGNISIAGGDVLSQLTGIIRGKA